MLATPAAVTDAVPVAAVMAASKTPEVAPPALKLCPHFEECARWGKLGALTPEQAKALEEFMRALKPTDLAQVTAPSETPSHAALRFLRGQLFSVPKALKQFNEHIDWRRTFKIDDKRVRDSRENFDIDITDVMKFYPCGVKGRDRCGRPLFIKVYGRLDVAKMEAVADQHVCASWETINTEKLRYLCDLHGREEGWHVEDNCVLLDFGGFALSWFNSYVRTSLAAVANMVEPNYPENLGVCIIVNAPWYMQAIWSVAKMFLPARTTQKFHIYGSNYKDKIFKYIDPAYLPVEYGGTGEKGFKSIEEILAGHGTSVLENVGFLRHLIPAGRRKTCAELRGLCTGVDGETGSEL